MSLLPHQKVIYTGQIISAPSRTLFDTFKMQVRNELGIRLLPSLIIIQPGRQLNTMYLAPITVIKSKIFPAMLLRTRL